MKKEKTRSYLITIGGAAIVFLLVLAYLNGQRSTTPVVVAKAALPAGARLTAQYLELKQLHTSAVMPGALKAVEDAAGQVLTIARAPGDQITADMLGDAATVGVASQLEPGHRAIAVHVNQASGLLGILRPGDRVSVVAVVDPSRANMQSQLLTGGYYEPVVLDEEAGSATGETAPVEPLYAPSSASYVIVSNLRVLVVPQTFRYEEVLPSESEGTFAPVRTSTSAQNDSVILLDVPIEPVEITDGLEVSPVALLALLDAEAKLHLVLEPTAGDSVTVSVGAELGDLYRAMVGWDEYELSASGVLTTTVVPEVGGVETTESGGGE